jgi:uncharacterized membrane protein YdjX (TVP38/TMEM64 family)
VIESYALLVAIVFGVNLLPAFGPPTWAVLVVLVAKDDRLAIVPTVLLGALAAASGRLVLALAARAWFRGRLSAKRTRSLAAAEKALTRSRTRKFTALALFALSPVPSAQLFVAAGLMRVRLLPLTGGFFAGRLVSYSLYVAAAAKVAEELRGNFVNAMTSPFGIAVEVVTLAALIAFLRIDWGRVAARARARHRRRSR